MPLILISFLLLSCSTSFAYYSGEGKDMGYWCTDCNRQHGPGETCPRLSIPNTNYQTPQGQYAPPQGSSPAELAAEKQRKEANELRQKGIDHFNNKQYQLAVDAFKAAMDKLPGDQDLKEWHKKASIALTNERLSGKKKELFKSMKGIEDTEGELGLKDYKDDASVVDLSDKKGPLVVHPEDVKGESPKVTRQKEISLLIWRTKQEMIMQLSKPKGIFQKDPEPPLINPLREPERYKAWLDAEKNKFRDRLNPTGSEKVAKVIEQDKGLNIEMNMIAKEEGDYIANMHGSIYAQARFSMDQLKKKHGIKTQEQFISKQSSDPEFKRAADAIGNDYRSGMNDAEIGAKLWSLKKLDVEKKKFFARHPELEK